jgi:hypothetical protein
MIITARDDLDLPDVLPSQLNALLDHWRDLRRGENEMPFSDDIDLSKLPGGPNRAILLSVFEGPLRFRLDHVGRDISERLGAAVTGKFLDEIKLHGPLDELVVQAAAVIERRAPRYYRQRTDYCRMLLPTWNDGRIGTLLGAVTWIT